MKENWARRREILRAIARYRARGGIPPSLRELATMVGLKSKKGVHGHLRKLEEHGYVLQHPQRRSYDLTEKGWELVGEMPVLGRIAAGPGMDAVTMDGVGSDLWRGILTGESFLLEVRGDSMSDAGIQDGDSVIVERDVSPENGEIVAALLHEETVTVKRLYREEAEESASEEGFRIRLKAENAAYEDIVLDGKDVVIQGRVRGLLRSLKVK